MELTPIQKSLFDQYGDEMLGKISDHLLTSMIHFCFNSLAEFSEDRKNFKKQFLDQWKRAVKEDIVNEEVGIFNEIVKDERFLFKSLVEDRPTTSTEDLNDLFNKVIKEVEENYWEADKLMGDSPDDSDDEKSY